MSFTQSRRSPSPPEEWAEQHATSTKVVWAPSAGPATRPGRLPAAEVFFGGARGGGKTDGVLGKWAIKEQRYGKHFNARMFRKATTTSEDAIERAKEIYLPLGAKFNETKLTFRMPHGGRVSSATSTAFRTLMQSRARTGRTHGSRKPGSMPRLRPSTGCLGLCALRMVCRRS
jgi:hypothetical protein